MKEQQEGFLIPNSFGNVINKLDRATIRLSMYLFMYFTTLDYNPLSEKVITISNLAKELKLSRNTVIRALDGINDNKVFIVKAKENCFPRTIIITLVS